MTLPLRPIRPFAAALLALAPLARAQAEPEALPPAEDLRAGGDEQMRYFLIGPKPGADAPKAGFKLLLVLPGGDGSADFETFSRRIAANATGDDWLVAQLVAPVWNDEQKKTCVWPTRTAKVEGMRFPTEDFVAAVLRDVEARQPVDPAHVFTLSWSSGGPAAYATSLDPSIGVTGSFVAMSVFKPDQLPPLAKAKGHAYWVVHSPQDFIPIAMAKDAVAQLAKAGADTELHEYAGGHGWKGDVYGMMRAGLTWLEEHHAKPDKKRLKESAAAAKARLREKPPQQGK